MNDSTPLDFDAVRARLKEARDRQYWRNLEELAGTEAFQEMLHREFPQGASEMADPVGRRTFLRLMGASLALAGVTACTKQPPERIIPYVKQPEGLVPGRPLFYATAMPLGGFATGLLVESHEGRPTKIEGNPQHPASLGSTDVFAQASVLDLYDPDRAQNTTYLGEIRPWSAFLSAMRAAVEAKHGRNGAGLRILTETVTSPTLAAQLRGLLADLPEAKWHQWEPAGRDTLKLGARLAFGEVVEPVYALDKAHVILSLDADLLTTGPAAVRHSRQFAAGRRVTPDAGEMNRLYVVDSTVSSTGQAADHRLPLRASEIEAFALALGARLGVPGLPADAATRLAQLRTQHPPEHLEKWLTGVATDLERHGAAAVVIPGIEQTALVHAVSHAINERLGAVGSTVRYVEPVEAEPVIQADSLGALVADIDAGKVDLLVIVGGNPVYTAPADLAFAKRLEKVAIRVHLGLHHDETSAACHWHVPEAHYLESWSDARAFDGTASVIQPVIAPLYGGRSAHEVVAAFTAQAGQPGYDIVRSYWKGWIAARDAAADFERFWRKSVHDGIVPGSEAAAKAVAVRAGAFAASPPSPSGSGLEIVFRPDPSVHDGRFANNGWLQELPRPHTRLTWDNAVLLNPSTAERLGVSSQDEVELSYRGRTVSGGAWLLPGLPRDTALVHLGYGRTRAGRVGDGAGFNASAIRTSQAGWFDRGLQLRRTGQKVTLVSAQLEQLMHGRELVRAATREEYRENPSFAQQGEHRDPPKGLTIYPEHRYEGYAWGMAIDLNTCTGCNACVVACQAENNIPVVGKAEVGRGHKMHWLRIDRYYEGDLDNPRSFNQPVPCMHCENAPCEVVCPVGATSHSSEGLNDMAYNRCVGTRYCSNNCPYKVRRFNFLLYQDWDTPTLKLQRNPDVTVRSRGVMEKCTFCVQRINAAKIDAEKENREVRDGEILTACQAVCPPQAITFGNINDRNSQVAMAKADPRNYGLLGELNTRPRTTYLAALRNPNPEMPAEEPAGAEAAR